MKVLLIEDNPTDVLLINNILDNIPNLELTHCEDGNEAVDYLKHSRNFDIVISDLHMPNMNGMEVTTWMVEHEVDIPLLGLTGLDEHYGHCFVDLGADGFLSKQDMFQQLVPTIKSIISQKTCQIFA